MDRIVYTRHALSTMSERAVTPDEVEKALSDYELRYNSPEHRGRPTPDTYIYQRGLLSVVVSHDTQHDTLVVKTVLLSGSRPWTDEDMRRWRRTTTKGTT